MTPTPNQSARLKRKPSWPKILSRKLPSGNVQFRIETMVVGNREFHSFKTQAEAIAHAWKMYEDRQKRGKAAFDLPNAQREQAAECFKMLAAYPAAKLTDAVRYYIDRKLRFVESPTIAAGVEIKLTEITNKVSHLTESNLSWRWRKFAKKFGQRQFGEIEPGEISVYLDEVAKHPGSRHNHRRAIVRLYNLAIHNKTSEGKTASWCRENPALDCDSVKRAAPEPGILKPEEVIALLSHADKYRLAPYIILGTFCGLRVAELQRLDWTAIDFTDRTIKITPEITKTKSRRVVDIGDASAAWLAPYVKKSGAVVDTVALRERLLELRKAAGLKRWPNNAMRHSFGTYALQAWQDAAKVAMQMGNSARVCETHYKAAGSRSAAAAFWSLRPDADASGKIVMMPAAANG